jgi:hypothetical protein
VPELSWLRMRGRQIVNRIDAWSDAVCVREDHLTVQKLLRWAVLGWLLVYTASLAVAHGEFWGPNALIEPARFDASDWTHWLTRLLFAPGVREHYLWLVAAQLLLLSLGLLGFYPRVMILGAVLTNRNLLNRAWTTTDGGTNINELFLIYLALMNTTGRPVSRALGAVRPWVVGASNCALAMARIQLSLVYLTAGLAKLDGPLWQNGTALFYILQERYYTDPLVGPLLLRHPVLLALGTYSTLAFQFAFPLLIWSRRARPWLLLVGVGLHLGIAFAMGLFFFGWMMILSYACFVAEPWAVKALGWCREVKDLAPSLRGTGDRQPRAREA